MNNILIIDNFDSFTYNIKALLSKINYECDIKNNLEVNSDQFYDRVIISPGPGNPLFEADRGKLFYFLDAGNYGKVLGLCFGHQALAAYLGGSIYRTDRIMHGEIDTIQHFGGYMFRHVPGRFDAIRYHSLAIRPGKNTKVTAVSYTDGTIMAFSSRNGRFSGLQFHPESFFSQFGLTIMGNFIGDSSVNS